MFKFLRFSKLERLKIELESIKGKINALESVINNTDPQLIYTIDRHRSKLVHLMSHRGGLEEQIRILEKRRENVSKIAFTTYNSKPPSIQKPILKPAG